MIGAKQLRRLPAASPGFVWPKSGTSTPDQIDSPFGPRPFPPYIPVTGYDYDFHRGQDIHIDRGDPVYATIAGSVVRATQTFYGWESARQRSVYWQTAGDGNATFVQSPPTTLLITGSRTGAQTFPACARLEPIMLNNLMNPTSGRWEFRASFTNPIAATGGVFGFGMYDKLTNEMVALEYDGTTLTARIIGSGGPMAASGTAAAVAVKFIDIYYDFAGVVNFRYTNDPTNVTWTTLVTQAGFAAAITNKGRPCWTPVMYWRSADVNAAPQTCEVDYFAFWDVSSVAKFGNWTQIANRTSNGVKMSQLHSQELLVFPGDIVEAGQIVALAGDTGMDEYSGLNADSHCHLEYAPTSDFFYNDYQGYNPQQLMIPASNGVMPRNPPTTIGAVISDAPAPNGVPSWKLEYTLQRNDQALDLNEITFVGTIATRIQNYNTGVGQDPVNFRTPVYDGIFSYADPFDDTSPTLVAGAYFSKAVVGDPVSASIKDPNGTTIWSWP